MWIKKHYIRFHFEFVMSCLMKFKQDKKCTGNRNCPGQHHICQGLFPYHSRIFPYFWSFSRLIKGLKNFQNIFQTFTGSVRILLHEVEQPRVEPVTFRSQGQHPDYLTSVPLTLFRPLKYHRSYNVLIYMQRSQLENGDKLTLDGKCTANQSPLPLLPLHFRPVNQTQHCYSTHHSSFLVLVSSRKVWNTTHSGVGSLNGIYASLVHH